MGIHLEIGLPNEKGRKQILEIHTKDMRKNKCISENVDLAALAKKTRNYTGAELKDLVNSAINFATQRHVEIDAETQQTKFNSLDIVITLADFEAAFDKIQPAFGVEESVFEANQRGGIIKFSTDFNNLVDEINSLIEQVKQSSTNNLLSVLLSGPRGCGKTALASMLALNSTFPFMRLISAESLIRYSHHEKINRICQIFDDAHKSNLSILVIDDLDKLIDYAPVGPYFSNDLLQVFSALVTKRPDSTDRRLFIIATTSNPRIISQLGLLSSFDYHFTIPLVEVESDIISILTKNKFPEQDSTTIAKSISLTGGIPIKKLLIAIDSYQFSKDKSSPSTKLLQIINAKAL